MDHQDHDRNAPAWQATHRFSRAAEGSEFITGDNYVLPLPNEPVDDAITVLFKTSTEFLMPFTKEATVRIGADLTHPRRLSLQETVVRGRSAKRKRRRLHFRFGTHLLEQRSTSQEVHDRNPYFDGKIVEVGGTYTRTFLTRRSSLKSFVIDSPRAGAGYQGRGSRLALFPGTGYRYDGLYSWTTTGRRRGRSGFLVWRYRLVKLPDRLDQEREPSGIEVLRRLPRLQARDNRTTHRERHEAGKARQRAIQLRMPDVRNAPGRTRWTLRGGSAHKAARRPHNGPDTSDNMLCLCPNHHVLFDHGGVRSLRTCR